MSVYRQLTGERGSFSDRTRQPAIPKPWMFAALLGCTYGKLLCEILGSHAGECEN